MMRLTTLFLVALMPVFLYSQSVGVENKDKGLSALHSGDTETALYYLNELVLHGLADGEVLGGLALAYILKGDAQRALEHAVDARKDRTRPSVDAFLAGFLAHEQLGNVRQRNRWMEQGLEAFPGDYLLLYHAGRVTIPFDSEKGETYLLKAIQAAPGFPPSHFLLGENMYRRGENLKALLPILYYLMLNHDGDDSQDLLVVIERLYDTWAASAGSISRVTRVSPGFRSSFEPVAWESNKNDSLTKMEWFKAQTIGLMNSMRDVEINSRNAMWTFYTDFFAKAAELDFAESLTMHILYSRYPADVMQWLLDNSHRYQMMADWLMVQ
ncbi:tetratricopeptide repeat protein [Alkaliflexus imshenetskii]|uniref:tetratricopeptide repeat protein n=1 Tax=Alkaliflexus imshenetskii TaxID=286730 RepID=UPI000478988D|nr:hypothetical protein [Alkaliflexus imshenetskii]